MPAWRSAASPRSRVPGGDDARSLTTSARRAPSSPAKLAERIDLARAEYNPRARLESNGIDKDARTFS